MPKLVESGCLTTCGSKLPGWNSHPWGCGLFLFRDIFKITPQKPWAQQGYADFSELWWCPMPTPKPPRLDQLFPALLWFPISLWQGLKPTGWGPRAVLMCLEQGEINNDQNGIFWRNWHSHVVISHSVVYQCAQRLSRRCLPWCHL